MKIKAENENATYLQARIEKKPEEWTLGVKIECYKRSWPEKLIQLWWGTKVGGKAQYVAEYTAGGYLGASTRPPDYKRLVLVPCSCESNDVIRAGKLGKGVVVLVSSQLHEPLFVNHIHHPYVSQDL